MTAPTEPPVPSVSSSARPNTSIAVILATLEECAPAVSKVGHSRHGDDSWTLPMPARFVIDRQGIMRWRDVDPDYTTRPEPADTVAALRALG